MLLGQGEGACLRFDIHVRRQHSDVGVAVIPAHDARLHACFRCDALCLLDALCHLLTAALHAILYTQPLVRRWTWQPRAGERGVLQLDAAEGCTLLCRLHND